MNDAQAYTRAIDAHFPGFLTQEEVILAHDAGDHDLLIRSHLPLVIGIAGQFIRRHTAARDHYDLLISAGNLALIESLKDYDPRVAKLTTWAYRKIWWTMSTEWKRQLRGLSPTTRIQRRMGIGNTKLLGDNKPEIPVNQTPYDVAERQDTRALLEQAIDSLRVPRHREVIRRRFLQGQMLSEVGQAMGISKERVRQIQVSALKDLRWRLAPLEEALV